MGTVLLLAGPVAVAFLLAVFQIQYGLVSLQKRQAAFDLALGSELYESLLLTGAGATPEFESAVRSRMRGANLSWLQLSDAGGRMLFTAGTLPSGLDVAGYMSAAGSPPGYTLHSKAGRELLLTLNPLVPRQAATPRAMVLAQSDQTRAITDIKDGAVASAVFVGLLSFLGLLAAAYARRGAPVVWGGEGAVAYHDPLTGLPSRGFFMENLENAIRRARRGKETLAVLYIGLDRFRMLNESLGHHAGDEVLRKASVWLNECVRAGEQLCRVGGDEFAVVLEGLEQTSIAARVCDRVFKRFTERLTLAGRDIGVQLSVGIAIFPDDSERAGQLIKDAEAAMRSAKELGGQRYVFYTQCLNASVEERFDMEQSLRQAMENNEMRLYFQPRVNTEALKISGVEALLRWQHPEKGLIRPALFVSMLEDNGLIVQVGNWVIDQACRMCAQWRAQGLDKLCLSVNLSLRQFRSETLVETVAQALREHGLPGSALELELTESVLADDAHHAGSALLELKRLGVRLSIDDFGTGYSSLAYLMKYPIDLLKIDREFVRDIARNADHVALVKTMIDMARNLNMSVVAEGVEDEEQFALLRKFGCDEVQGYLFSPPLPPDAVPGVAQALNFDAVMQRSLIQAIPLEPRRRGA